MKQLFLFISLCTVTNLFSQQYRHPVGGASQLKMVNIPADVEVHASDGSDIEITYIAENGKTIAAQGNSGIALQVQSTGNAIEIKGLLSKRISGRYVLQVPRKLSMDIRSDGITGELNGEGIQGDINIITTGNVSLEDMGGGIAVQSADGNVAIRKPALSHGKPVSVITQGGNVFIALNSGTNTELKLGTATGHILLSYNTSKKGNMLFSGKQLSTPLGKGGPTLQVQTLSGNVSVNQAQ
jgi:DUF4097 and DUF4098 domain-containing protein YvlB